MENLNPLTFLVFGDLHGRVLPAFRFGSYWSRRHDRKLAGLLQVGDPGFFPDLNRMDKATLRHAKDDPLELGTFDYVTRTELGDRVFDEDPFCPPAIWFTAGNHEDFEMLQHMSGSSGDQSVFSVDAFGRVWGIKDGRVATLPEIPEALSVHFVNAENRTELRVGAIWGVDGENASSRKNLPPRGYIREAAVNELTRQEFDVLLSHDAPFSSKRVGYGSQQLRLLIELTQPQFAFFGHYKGYGSKSAEDFGRTEVYHLSGFELRTRAGHPESGSVGVLEHSEACWRFSYVPDDDLTPFTRHNWKWA